MIHSSETIHILIVDDESQLGLLRRLLQKLVVGNVEVTATSNVEMAIGLAVSNRVDICVTDLDMPGKNGLELLKVLKDTNPLILVNLLTAVTSEKALRISLAFGADDFLPKTTALGITNRFNSVPDYSIATVPKRHQINRVAVLRV
jgi:DNA-binding response OmpR family regulator